MVFKAILHNTWSIILILFLMMMHAKALSAHPTDSTRSVKYFGGSAAVTNNGISLLPTFSLNKPAALIILNAGKRLTFDPEFRFSLDGKPWSFVFWWRYKLIQGEKFRLNIGAHPAYLFLSQTIPSIGNSANIITTERYLATEISPKYYLTKNTSLGIYYLRAKGFEESSVQNTHFLTVNANFDKIKLYKSLYLNFHPQIYYLKVDEDDGYYITSTLTLAKTDFPLSVQTVMNQTIKSNIPSKDFIWNLSLIYTFGKLYKPV
jgi:hypothetical protein